MKNSFVSVVSFTRPVWPYSTIRLASSQIDDLDHGARLRRVVGDLVLVLGPLGALAASPISVLP